MLNAEMLNEKFEQMYEEFQKNANQAAAMLEGIMDTLSDGRVPSDQEQSQLGIAIKQLCVQYNDFCSKVGNELQGYAVLPEEGSSIDAFYEAIRDSDIGKIKKRIQEAIALLQRFVSVQSNLKSLTSALNSYQQEARNSLVRLKSGQVRSMEEIHQCTLIPTMFMNAFAIRDFNTEEGMRELEKMTDEYGFSSKITNGLASRGYFIPVPEDEIKTLNTEEALEEHEKSDVMDKDQSCESVPLCEDDRSGESDSLCKDDRSGESDSPCEDDLSVESDLLCEDDQSVEINPLCEDDRSVESDPLCDDASSGGTNPLSESDLEESDVLKEMSDETMNQKIEEPKTDQNEPDEQEVMSEGQERQEPDAESTNEMSLDESSSEQQELDDNASKGEDMNQDTSLGDEMKEEDRRFSFQPIIEKTDFLCKQDDFGFLSKEIPETEHKKVSAKVFMNDMKNGDMDANKIIVKQIAKDELTSPKILNIIHQMPMQYASRSLELLLRKGYLRKYTLVPDRVFYCSSVRLKKSLTYKDASKFIGRNPLSLDSFGEEIEDLPSGAAARLAYLNLYADIIRTHRKNGGTSYSISQQILQHSFLCRINYDRNENVTDIALGVFWPNYDESEMFTRLLNRWFSETAIGGCIGRVFICALTKEKAAIFANAIRAYHNEVLKNVPCILYSFSQESYYSFDGLEERKPDEIWQGSDEPRETVSTDTKTDSSTKDVQASTDNAKVETAPQKTLHGDYEKDSYEQNEETLASIMCSGSFYVAAAFAKAASGEDERFVPVYERIAYALNDPMYHLVYSSDNVFKLISEDQNELTESMVLAAAIRTFFSSQIKYDYNIKGLYNAIKDYSQMSFSSSLCNVVYKLVEFKDQHKRGIDTYADYHAKTEAQLEKEQRKIQQEATEFYDCFVMGKLQENASQRRFLETKKMLLHPNGDLGTFMRAIVDHITDLKEEMEHFLLTECIREDHPLLVENIDPDKVLAYILAFWDKAGEKMVYSKRADLMSHLRNNIVKITTKAFQMMTRWCILLDKSEDRSNDQGAMVYKKIRKPMLDSICDADGELKAAMDAAQNPYTQAGFSLICHVLDEIRRCIEGTFHEYEHKYFYADFLLTDDVLLDEFYIPDLNMYSMDIADLTPKRRVLHHLYHKFKDTENGILKTPVDRLEEIFDGGQDDYGSAMLLMNYLEEQNPALDIDLYRQNFATSLEYAKERDKIRLEKFIGDLELAQSYGQIGNVNSTEDKKEKILQIVNDWHVYAVETSNYGFLSKITQGYIAQIRSKAKEREKDFQEQLETFKKTEIKNLSTEDKEKKLAKIQAAMEQQNYTVVEDLLARADQVDEGLDVVEDEKFLDDFLADYSEYYKQVSKSSSFSSLVIGRTRNKEERGGKKLADNWLPGGSLLGEDRLVKLLNGLGFATRFDLVKKQSSIGRFENFHVKTLQPTNGNRANYTHPISAFGSAASTDGFRVVCLNGKYDAAGLIDVMKQIGNAKHTMILLDCALDIPERRILARKSKSKLSDKLFIVIDRVVMMYLVKNYEETNVNRMLMALVTPFGYFQPYIWESANVMPPEIFIGRKFELERIKSPAGVNIVYGGRQLGKSALLKQAKADIDQDENNNRAVLIDIKGLQYKEVAKKIGETLFDEEVLSEEISTTDWNVLSRAIRKRLMDTVKPIPYLLLLLDEADAFIESCEEVNYHPFDVLKEIQSIGVGRFKFVIAGLRNIVRFKREIALGNNSVLTHLESMTVKPFKPAEARELMELPLRYLGLEFPKEKESLITLILASANYFPGLIQMYCAKLLLAMRNDDYAGYDESNTPVYEISEEHIKKVLANPEFTNQIRNKFFITLKLDQDNYYYLIALVLAYLYHGNGYNEGYSAKDIIDTCSALEIAKIADLGMDKMSALLEELRELNVLRSTDEMHYLFTRFSFFQMMGTLKEVENKLVEYMEG